MGWATGVGARGTRDTAHATLFSAFSTLPRAPFGPSLLVYSLFLLISFRTRVGALLVDIYLFFSFFEVVMYCADRKQHLCVNGGYQESFHYITPWTL